MHTFFSWRARTFLISFSALFSFLIFFQLYSSDLQDSLVSYAPTFATDLEEASGVAQNDDEATQSELKSTEQSAQGVSTKVIAEATTAADIMSDAGSILSPTQAATSTARDEKHEHATASSPSVGSASPTASESSSLLTGAIVAAVGSDTDLEWVSEIVDPMWKLHRYDFDDPKPPPETHFPINKGNEAMMYLSYVINNHDALPDYSIFIHGHRESWHQEGDMVDIINNFRLMALEKAGYAPLRCDWYPSCPREIRPIDHDVVVWGPGVHREDTEYEIGRVWSTLFGNETMPRTIASQCCAQFALTRKAILQRPKADYERMRQWLIDTELINDVSGRVLEKLWAYIFTKEGIRCPPPQQCACDFFGQCEPKAWTMPPEGIQKWPDSFDRYGTDKNATVAVESSNSTTPPRSQQYND